MFRAIAGIKNEVKSIIRSCYSFMWSALTKILKKVVGHSIFGGPIWIRNDSKTEFLSYRQAWIAKKLTKIATHIIFFLWKLRCCTLELSYLGPLFGAPRDAILIWKSILFQKITSKIALSGDPESLGPQIGPQIGIRKVDPLFVFFKTDHGYNIFTILASKYWKNAFFRVFWPPRGGLETQGGPK